MTFIALDIDGTPGYRNHQQYIKTGNEILKLALAEACLQGLSMKSFYVLPEVQACRERVGETHYTRVPIFTRTHYEPYVHLLEQRKVFSG